MMAGVASLDISEQEPEEEEEETSLWLGYRYFSELRDVNESANQPEKDLSCREMASVRLHLLARGLCCRSKPRVRCVHSKGAILILLWNCLIPNYTTLNPGLVDALGAGYVARYVDLFFALSLLQGIFLFVLSPLAGWLADGYFGRYRVIKASLWLIWIGAILLALCLCIIDLSPDQADITAKVVLIPPSLIAIELGIAGVNANLIPFGIDQLHFASGDQLRTFIAWFVGTHFVKASFLVVTSSFCHWLDNNNTNTLFFMLLLVTLLSVALILDFLFKDWLVMENRTSNPFKLVYRVLKYAWKTKQPVQRSAFTYHDQKKPSRIEYGKPLYGGPFTTEQVEDVKTFLKIASALLPIGAGIAFANITLIIYIFWTDNNVLFSCQDNTSIVGNIFPFLMVLSIPLYEILVYPFLHNYIPSMLTRFGIGIVLFVLCNVSMLAITIATGDAGDRCLFNDDGNLLQSHPFWSAIPQLLMASGAFFSFTGGWEFIFSQTPHNIKGVVMGATFALHGFFLFVFLVILLPFYSVFANYYADTFSCWIVYFTALIVLGLFWIVVYILVARSYRRRNREDTRRYQNYNEDIHSKYLT